MAENITYPPYDAMLAGTSVLNTWSDGTQFSIGNTTYAWDSTPGLWRAFTTATSSSGGGGSEFVNFDPRAVATSTNTLTAEGTLTAGENGAYGWFTASTLDRMTVTVTGDGSIMMPGGSTNYNVDRQNAGLPRGFTTSFTITADSANSRDFVGGMFYLGPNGTITGGNFNGAQFEVRMVDIVPASAGGGTTTVNIGGSTGGGGIFTVQTDARNGANDPTTITEVTFTANYTATYHFLLIGGGGRGRGSGASVLHSEPITEGTMFTISVGGGGDDMALPGSAVGGDSTVVIGGSVIARASGGGSTSTDIGNGVIAPQNPLIPPAISVNATASEDSWAIFGANVAGSQGRDQGTSTNNAIGGRIQFVGTV